MRFDTINTIKWTHKENSSSNNLRTCIIFKHKMYLPESHNYQIIDNVRMFSDHNENKNKKTLQFGNIKTIL